VQCLSSEVDDRQHGRLSGATNNTGQSTKEPIGKRPGKDRVRIFQSGRADLTAATHDGIECRATDQHKRREYRCHSDGDDDAMNDKGGGICMAAGANGTCHSRGDGSAHARVGHLLHQHDQREDEGDAC
jgi:hypothetical protein